MSTSSSRGALLRTGDGIRVSCQLTDASAGTLLWSHATEVQVGNLFQVQDKLVHRIVDSLSLPLTARTAHAPQRRAVGEARI